MTTISSSHAPQPRASKKRLVLLLGAVAALLGVGGVVAMRVLGRGPAAEEAPRGELLVGDSQAPGHLPEDPGVVALDPFVVNLADREGDRYMRCTIRLVLEDEAGAKQLSASDIEITKLRDRIMLVLTSKRAQQAASHAGRQELRRELREAIQPLLDETPVIDVFFTEYLIQ